MTYSRTTWANKVNSGDPITISDHDVNDDDIVSFINDLESKVIFKTDEIGTSNIADSAITTDKITNNNITTTKIANDAVTTAKIANGNVTEDKLANDAVTEDKIKNGNVTTNKIYNGSVNASKLASNAVETAKIKDGNVTDAKLASNSITTAKIKDGNVTEDKLASNSVTTAKIKDGNVTTAKIADSNVTTNKIADGAVTDAKANFSNLAVGTITPLFNYKINVLTGVYEKEKTSITDDIPTSGYHSLYYTGTISATGTWKLKLTNYTSGIILFVWNGTNRDVDVYKPSGALCGTIKTNTGGTVVIISNTKVMIC